MAPCEDLLGSWPLRVLIWVVFVVTLFGNGLVLTVILASPKPPRRLGPPVVDCKVSQFYISQLDGRHRDRHLSAVAVVDLKTFERCLDGIVVAVWPWLLDRRVYCHLVIKLSVCSGDHHTGLSMFLSNDYH